MGMNMFFLDLISCSLAGWKHIKLNNE